MNVSQNKNKNSEDSLLKKKEDKETKNGNKRK